MEGVVEGMRGKTMGLERGVPVMAMAAMADGGAVDRDEEAAAPDAAMEAVPVRSNFC